MTPQIDDALLESIVAGVLDRLRGPSAPVAKDDEASEGRQPPAPSKSEIRNPKSEVSRPGAGAPRSPEPRLLADRVITEAVLEANLNGSKAVRFTPKAVLTPSARDYLKTNGIEWAYATRTAGDRKPASGRTRAAIVVRSTPAVERVVADLLPGSRRELLGCPDDAAKLAIAEIARGGFAEAVIFAEQSHRAACLANRHEAVKAVVVRDATDVAAIRKQLRANVWCLDPTGRGYFELRNLVKAITA
ncbi:MAG TPA: hypothetical protein VF170_05125 [Planctomycetaceae bacterium]